MVDPRRVADTAFWKAEPRRDQDDGPDTRPAFAREALSEYRNGES